MICKQREASTFVFLHAEVVHFGSKIWSLRESVPAIATRLNLHSWRRFHAPKLKKSAKRAGCAGRKHMRKMFVGNGGMFVENRVLPLIMEIKTPRGFHAISASLEF